MRTQVPGIGSGWNAPARGMGLLQMWEQKGESNAG